MAIGAIGDAVARSLQCVPADATVVVALSGGVDSIVLLDALAQRVSPARLVAWHVDHALQSHSDRWSQFCEEQARRYGVAFGVTRLDTRPATGENVEGWARAARYRALWHAVARSDAAALLTAHQADDQLETVMMRLARGSGPEALGGMAPAQRRADRWLLRPLLEIGRETIVAHAHARALQWIDDPMNADDRYLRVSLRTRVIPQFCAVVPSLRENVLRSAQLLRESGETLRWLAARDLREAGLEHDARAIDRRALAALPAPRRDRAVRAWFEMLGATMPNRARLEQWIAQMLLGRSPHAEVVHERWRFRRYRDRITTEPLSQAEEQSKEWSQAQATGVALHAPRHQALPAVALRWRAERSIALAAWGGSLRFEPSEEPGALDAGWLAAQSLEVRSPRGSARLRPRHGGPSRTLKNLFQEHGVPPWLRAQMPALYAGDRLLLVGGVGMDRSPTPATASARVVVHWMPDDPEDPRGAFGQTRGPV